MGDILLFPGQGSTSHFSDHETIQQILDQLGDNQAVFQGFVQSCKVHFQEEYDSLPPEDQSSIGAAQDILDFLQDNQSFLTPPPALQSHPVFETTTLFIRQVLELILYQSRQDGSDRPIETAGVCTGVLPAALAASYPSYLSPQFIRTAGQSYRLAFWIGVRVSQFCREAAGDAWRDLPWALSVFGLSVDEVEQTLSKYIAELTTTPIPRISAVFAPDNISLSGSGPSLSQFKTIAASQHASAHFRSPHVHGYYHGGSESFCLVDQVLEDVRKREITFPTWQCLQISLRSVATGQLLDPVAAAESGPSLLEVALQSIFVETVGWQTTLGSLTQSLSEGLDKNPDSQSRVIGMGPNAASLVRDMKSTMLSSKVSIIDSFGEFALSSPPDAYAIVGLSVNYPKGNGLDEFWETIMKGESTLSTIPDNRFDITSYGKNDDGKGKQKPTANHGNFLDDAFRFDAAYFNISPREAKCMDPQQRLLLHVAAGALEDAGYSPNSTPTFIKDKFGVFVGVATGDYVDNLREDIDVYYSPGTLRAFLSGRISYALGLKGPSIVFDTACSSSTVALHHACQSLKSGECTVALAGGINVMSSPYMHLGLSRAHFLSPTGQCKPFDVSADGYCRAEGAGLVVVKKLSDAIREGDHIHGVIRGIGLNQCGTAKSITHPDAATQAELFTDVLSRSRIDPDSISLVETHGTGTQAGDFAEITSLQSTFGVRAADNPLHISSVKGNIGHAEAASGLAGLTKLLLAMREKKLPPQASFKTLNPRLKSIGEHNIVIPTVLTDWKTKDKTPRRALLNNFGAAGSNAALILEEYTGNTQRPVRASGNKVRKVARSSHILNISAKTPAALEHLREEYLNYIKTYPNVKVEDLCYTATARKRNEGYAHRISVLGSDVQQLEAQLRQEAVTQVANLKAAGQRKTVFVFSGQGGIYAGMGGELLLTSPRFRSAVERCDGILTANGFPAVSSYLLNSESWKTESKPVVEQSACFVIEYALAQMFIHWGLKPDAVVGHSIGEYAALVTAGALTLEDGLLFVATRASLMTAKCPPASSGMLACALPASEIASLLAQESLTGISVACENSPRDCVVAGSLNELTKFSELAKAKKIKNKLLEVAYGFHSPAMNPILEDIESYATSLKPCRRGENAIDIGLSTYGRVLAPGEQITSDYFAKQTRSTVQFSQLAQKLAAKLEGENVTVLEAGPSPITLPMVKAAFDPATSILLPSLRPKDQPWAALCVLLRSLFLNGVPVKWREVCDSASRMLYPFPQYPLYGSEFLIPFREFKSEAEGDGSLPTSPEPLFEFLTSRGASTPDKPEITSFTTPVKQLAPFIKAHAVGNIPLCPASVFMEYALEGAVITDDSLVKATIAMEDITFDKPLVYDDNAPACDLQLQLDRSRPEEQAFSFMSGASNVHCSGTLRPASAKFVNTLFSRKEAFVKRQKMTSFEFGGRENANSFSSRTIYELIFPRVVAYSEPFLTLDRLTVSSTGLEGFGQFRVSGLSLQGSFVCAPAFIDTMLHAAGFIANIKVNDQTACICTKVDLAILPEDSMDVYERDLDIYCSLVDLDDAIVADAYVLTQDGKVVSCVEGMSFRKINKAGFKASLARAAGKSSPATSKRTPAPASARRSQSQTKEDIPRTQQTQQLSDIEGTVMAMVKEVCGAGDNTCMSTTLSEMGVDSLLFIELADSIRNQLPAIQVSTQDLEACNTVGDLMEVIKKGAPLGSSTTQSSPSMSDDGKATFSESSTGSISTPVTPPDSEDSGIEGLLEDICGLDISSVDKTAPLSTLGIDSLLSIELQEELQSRLGLTIDNGHEGISELTVVDLQRLYAKKFEAPTSHGQLQGLGIQHNTPSPQVVQQRTPELSGVNDFPSRLQAQQSASPKTPLYLFHDGSGLSSMYRRLESLDRNIHGIFSLDGSSPAEKQAKTMEELAALYIDKAGLAKPQDVLLGGWSFGGVLAFEVSRQLRAHHPNVTVKGVILIDSPVPIDHEPLPEQVISHVVGNKGRDSPLRKQVQSQFSRHAGMLERYSRQSLEQANGGGVPCAMIFCTKTMDTGRACGVSYPWLSDGEYRSRAVDRWEKVVGRRLLVLDLDCDHFEVFEDANIKEVSEKLAGACALLEGRS
ncbi:putative polyketide synthase [Triangularia verruculosa]|uniref:Polyketide synthase n=1 Tax=Triangularia verruculosa TaxID=2587418 RepID=A0AAN6XS69_9PEZI|nr:putative polyketide synthase [Triangularia verruculosa]